MWKPRRQAQDEAPFDNAAQLRLIIDNIPALSVAYDENLRCLFANKRFAERFGLTRANIVGRHLREIVGEAAFLEVKRHFDRVLAGHPTSYMRTQTLASGERRHLEVELIPRIERNGICRGLFAVTTDVTERKREEQLRILGHAVRSAIATADSSPAAIREVIRAICESERWDCGRYFRPPAPAAPLRLAEGWGIDEPEIQEFLERSKQIEYQPGVSLIGQVWSSGEAFWIPDMSKDPRALRKAYSSSLIAGGAFIFPVKVQEQVIAVLTFNSRERRLPDERLLQVILNIGSQIGEFLQRKDAEQQLRDSEARYRSLADLAADIYWEQDSQYRFTKISGTHAKLVEATRGHIGKARWECDYINMGQEEWAAHRALLDARHPFRDLELYKVIDAGEPVAINVSGEPVFDALGSFLGYRGVARDVTARKRADQLLNLEHTVTRALADATTVAAALRESMRAICESENYDCGRYFEFDPAHNVMAFRECWYVEDEAVRRYVAASGGFRYARGEGLVGTAWQSGGPLWVPDARNDPRVAHPQLARETGMSAVLNFPVLFEGRIIGIISIISRRVPRPDERLLRSLGISGSQIGQFLERKRVEERQAVHARYQESIARFGQFAIGTREDFSDLVESAVRGLFEGLRADTVAYVEPGTEPGQIVAPAVLGAASDTGGERAVAVPEGAFNSLLAQGARRVSGERLLPFSWADAMASTMIVPVRGARLAPGALCAVARRPNAFGDDELNFVDATVTVLSTALQRIDNERQLEFMARFDGLTGLPNRALFADRFSQMIVQARRHTAQLGVLFIDLDDFKLVNDTLGHAAGDELLRQTAARIQAALRSGDTVARISGDEFAAILGDLARAEDAALVAEKIIGRLSQPIELRGKETFITASIGVAVFPADGDNAETLLGAADAAMYRAKQSGRNSYQFFTPEIAQRSRVRRQLAGELRRALEREEFELFYQPKYTLQDRLACSVEALLRWRHPERGLVAPVEFIPVLEETGLIVAAGDWVLKQACRDIKEWQAEGLRALPVAVNLSARQFRQRDLDQSLRATIDAAGVNPSLIELEITESHLMQDPEHAIRVMHSLIAGGMRVAIDDFGTGYSSLSYLTRFPVSSLKIDRSFVAEALRDEAAATIVRTIIEMAHTLGFVVVAEGVENEAQAQMLRGLRCEQAQGYLFARPMPAQELKATVLVRR